MFFNKKAPSLLEKVPLIDVTEAKDNARDKLLKDAQDVLGYGTGPLLTDVHVEVQEKLNELGYDFLNSEKVKEYQISKLPVKQEQYLHLHWSRVGISSYLLQIPDFALSKAVELKRCFPAAGFLVESFDANPDPFLIMEYKGQLFYVEVWDEPKFEARKIVADR
jgi:hypothetical protein